MNDMTKNRKPFIMMKQKRMIQWVMAATLVCGASVFVSCTDDTSDNPVQPQGLYPVTVKEGGEVTPKVVASPGLATEGQTVTLTALHGYKFSRVEVDNAPVTFKDNDGLIINMTRFSAPITWTNDTTHLVADNLPGFKPVTTEEAAHWVPSESDKENGAYLIYGFDEKDSVYMYAMILGDNATKITPARVPRSFLGLFGNLPNPSRFYYTSGATVIDDKTKATFRMPAGAASVDCDMVRDMSVDVTATMSATKFGLKKDGEGFVLTEGEGMTAILPDVYDEIGAPLVSMQENIDYVLRLQKQGNTANWWDNVKVLSEGTFRWQIIGIGAYEGIMTTATFTLSVVSE